MSKELSISEKLKKLKELKNNAVAETLAVAPTTPAANITSANTATGQQQESREKIAIIGMHGYLPGAMDLATFWSNLEQAQSAITEIPADRFDWRHYYDATGKNGMATKWGGFIPDIRSFDPAFFGVLPDEADMLDPQQRLLLMSTYKTIEDAGYAPSVLKNSNTGVYVGLEDNEYVQYLKEQQTSFGPNALNHHPSMAANRLSYFFDLRGPSEIVNTMCSSAAVAIHRAVSALGNGEIKQAIVGAARVILRPEYLAELSKLNVLSKSNVVKSFGEGADGYIRAEGVATILLKPLSAAERDGDSIYAVIRNAATNYNGRGGMSIAAPNIESHTQVLLDCYRKAGIDIRHLGYLELQGMGNQVSDIAEWEACNRALEILYEKNNLEFIPGSCRVSTLKPLIGHMETTSALAAIFKVVHSFKRNKIFGIANFDKVNPYLKIAQRPCRLTISDEVWEKTEYPRLAAIHSFGSGGSNAHLLLEEYREKNIANNETGKGGDSVFLVPLSSGSAAQLRKQTLNLAKLIASERTFTLQDIAYTLQVGRVAMKYRVGILARDKDELAQALHQYALGIEQLPNLKAAGPAVLETGLVEFNRAAPEAALELWCSGKNIDWAAAYAQGEYRRLHLPTYEFKQTPCWIAPKVLPVVSPAEAQVTTQIADPLARQRGLALTPKDERKKRICVIGAGPSGLVMAKSLLEAGHEPVVYEKQGKIGGLWVLNKHKKAGAYKKTRFQSSRFTSIFSDFESTSVRSTFFSVDDIGTYLNEYAQHFNVLEKIHFHSEVLRVVQEGDKWKVELNREGQQETHSFDGVAMCQGSFWHPSIPEKNGLAGFKGKIMHSAEYYDNSEFVGKKVVVVGSGVSAMDIAEEVSDVAQIVYWSKRSTKLILPRMVGFVPNDCQSTASLMIEENRVNLIERLKFSMPAYFAAYERSGLLPTREEFEKNPIVHINETIVHLVDQGKITAVGDIAHFEEWSCAFSDDPYSLQDVDIVVFATGYRDYESEKIRYPFLQGVNVEKDFSMGMFYSKNPSLVTSSVLPIAFTGSFYFMEMAARWYAQIMSGKYKLTAAELAHRITRNHYLIIAPISMLMFGLRLGLFPKPEQEFREFWRLINYPAFPMIYRLRGIHASPQAASLLHDFKARSFVKTENEDPALRTLKYRILAGLGNANLHSLKARGEITEEEYIGAGENSDAAITLDWDAQYIMGDPANTYLKHEPTPQDISVPTVHAALVNALLEIMADVLRIDQTVIVPTMNFSDFGFDSITLTSFAQRISSHYPFVEFSPSLFIENSNPDALATYLANAYSHEWEALFGTLQVIAASEAPVNQLNAINAMPQPDVQERLHFISAALKNIMANIMRIDTHEVDANKNLSEYGFDSITLTSFANKIAEQFPFVSLSPMVFIEHATLGEIARYLESGNVAEWDVRITRPVAKPESILTTSDIQTSAPAIHRGNDTRHNLHNYRHHKHVDILSTAASNDCAFWFHGAFGTADVYQPLAKKLAGKINFIGIRNDFNGGKLAGDFNALPLIGSMAESYADIISDIVGTGHYHLGGYSQGGVLAFEVARQLQERQCQVKSIVMLDAPFPPVTSHLSAHFLKTITFINILRINKLYRQGDQETLFKLSTDAADITAELVVFAEARGLKYQSAELVRILDMFAAVLQLNASAMNQFTLAPLLNYTGIEMHYFRRARKEQFFDAATASAFEELQRQNNFYLENDCWARWKKLVPSLQLHATSARDHFSLLEDASTLADIASRCEYLYTTYSNEEKTPEKLFAFDAV